MVTIPMIQLQPKGPTGKAFTIGVSTMRNGLLGVQLCILPGNMSRAGLRKARMLCGDGLHPSGRTNNNNAIAVGVIFFGAAAASCWMYWGYSTHLERINQANATEKEWAMRVNWDLHRYPLYAYKPDTCFSVRLQLAENEEEPSKGP
jgi:hypothetical protein